MPGNGALECVVGLQCQPIFGVAIIDDRMAACHRYEYSARYDGAEASVAYLVLSLIRQCPETLWFPSSWR